MQPGLRDRTRRVIPILASPLSTSTSAPRLHARLTAVLAAAFRSIGTEVAALVSTEFDELFDAGCNQRHPAAVHSRPLASRGMRHHGPGAGDGGRDLGARVRNAAFVGELAKFSLVSGSTIFAMLKRCVDAFSPPQVRSLVALMDQCKGIVARMRAIMKCAARRCWGRGRGTPRASTPARQVAAGTAGTRQWCRGAKVVACALGESPVLSAA
eukprot:scaffold199535_cov26-Tisochrysis_lutea.AAC.5